MINIALCSIRFRSLIAQCTYVNIFSWMSTRKKETFLKPTVVTKAPSCKKNSLHYAHDIWLRMITNNSILQSFFQILQRKNFLRLLILKIHKKQCKNRSKRVFHIFAQQYDVLSAVINGVYIYIYICGDVIVCGTRGKQGRSKWESWHELAVKSCISFRPRRFQNPRRRRTSQSPSRNVRGGRQWRPIAYISPVSRCSRLLITREFRPRTRVINGSGPSPRYRGTKLRANLPQPYINPDFLTLLSQRSPSSSSFPLPPPSSCWIPPWYNTMNLEACITLSRLFARRHPTKLY